jgi:peptide/nickel transport system substrate-binding protein
MLSTAVPTEDNGYIRNDGRTYVFPIRQGVKFHNGATLTPQDVEYTFKRAIIHSSPSGPISYMLIPKFLGVQDITDKAAEYVGVSWADMIDADGDAKPEYRERLINFYNDVIDPLVIVEGNEVHLNIQDPSASFLFILAHGGSWASILNKDWMIKEGNWDGKADGWWKYYYPQKEESPLFEKAMGTGPFKLVDWNKAQQRFELERFDDYWRGPAKLKTVIRQGIDEWATRRTMLERGEADIIMEIAMYMDQMEGRENEGIKVLKGLGDLTSIVLNMTWEVKADSRYIFSGRLDGQGVPPDFFTDKNVRLAFQHLINYEAIINDVLNGNGMRMATTLAKPLLGYSEEIAYPEFNLKIAENYFRRAYRGRLWDTGFKIGVLYNIGNDIRRTVAEMVRDNLARINPRFQAEVIGLQWAAYLDARNNKEMPVYALGWAADYPDPTNFINVYYSSEGYYGVAYGDSYKVFSNQPQPFFGGASLDAYINLAAKELDQDKRAEMYERIQQFVVGEAIAIPLYQPTSVRFMRDWVQNFIFNPIRPGYDFWELYKE